MRTHLSALLLPLCLGLTWAACSDGAPAPRAPSNSTALRPIPVADTQPSREVSDQRLAAEVERFLDTWVVKRDPQAAVEGRLSSALADERFLPPDAFRPGEYGKRFATQSSRTEAAVVGPQEFEGAVQQQLASRLDPTSVMESNRGGLVSLLAPFSPDVVRDTAPDFWRVAADRNPRSLPVAGVPSIAYQVRNWDDIAWTASPTIGYRAALAEVIVAKRLDVQAVVTKLKAIADAPESFIVTLWSDEGRGGTEWRLVGVELPRVY